MIDYARLPRERRDRGDGTFVERVPEIDLAAAILVDVVGQFGVTVDEAAEGLLAVFGNKGVAGDVA